MDPLLRLLSTSVSLALSLSPKQQLSVLIFPVLKNPQKFHVDIHMSPIIMLFKGLIVSGSQVKRNVMSDKMLIFFRSVLMRSLPGAISPNLKGQQMQGIPGDEILEISSAFMGDLAFSNTMIDLINHPYNEF